MWAWSVSTFLMTSSTRFVPLFGAIALGTVLGSRDSHFEPGTIGCILCCTVLLWLLLEYRGNRCAKWLFWMVVVTAAFLRAELAFREVQWGPEPVQEAVVTAVQVENSGAFLRVLGRYPEQKTRVALHLPVHERVEVGDQVVFTGSISTPEAAPNPGVFCLKTYLASQGATGVCWPDEYEIQCAHRRPLLQRIRSCFAANIQRSLSDPALVLALVLGDRSQLSAEQKERWQRLGTAHLLAISGTHFGLLALMIGVIVNRLPMGRLAKFGVLQAFLCGYLVLAGPRPSTLRAFLTGLIGGWGGLRRRRISSLEVWAWVGCCLLVAEPRLVTDISFQLSFGAAGGIILWGPMLGFGRLPRAIRWAASSLALSAVAQLSLLPLLLLRFGSVPLLGVVATLIMVPFVSALLIGGILLGLGLGGLGLNPLMEKLLALLEVVETGLGRWAAVWQPMRVGIDVWLLWLLFIWAGWSLRKPQVTRPRTTLRRLTWAALFLALLFSLPPPWKYPLEVTALNVGHGDCVFILTPWNQVVLVDGGGDSPYWQERGRNVGLERVVPYLRHRGVRKVDAVVLSHPDEDHLFGLLAVLEHFEIGAVFDNGQPAASQTYEKYVALLADKGIPRYKVRAGDQLTLRGGVRIRFLHPREETVQFLTHNDASVVAALDFQRTTVLFTGDLERVGFLDLVEHSRGDDLRADVLKVPHHGSRSSLEPRLYDVVSPQWALICAGHNSFGHPHEDVLHHLADRRIKWRTTYHGPVSFFALLGFLWVR